MGEGEAVSETQLVRAILDALHAKGVWCWRVNAGLTVFGASAGHAKRVIKGAPNGTPDIIGIVPGSRGRLFGLEAKSPTGKQNPNQRAWEIKATALGVRYGVVRSIGEALALLDAWQLDK